MNKWIVGGVIAAVVVIGGLVFIMNQANAPSSDQPSGQVITVDTQVAIKNSAFTPRKITIKKGVTVTWTNQDSMSHNVVSDSDAPAGGPAKDAPLLGNGETFSHTYNTVGTFNYHCGPHSFKGTVEVVE